MDGSEEGRNRMRKGNEGKEWKKGKSYYDVREGKGMKENGRAISRKLLGFSFIFSRKQKKRKTRKR